MTLLTWDSYFFDYGMRFVGGPVSWRVPIACQVIFAFVSTHQPSSVSLFLCSHRTRPSSSSTSAYRNLPVSSTLTAGTMKLWKCLQTCSPRLAIPTTPK